MPFREPLGLLAVECRRGVLPRFQQQLPSFQVPGIDNLAFPDVLLPQLLECLYTALPVRYNGRDREIVGLLDFPKEFIPLDENVAGVVHRVEEFLQGLYEQVVFLGGQIGTADKKCAVIFGDVQPDVLDGRFYPPL